MYRNVLDFRSWLQAEVRTTPWNVRFTPRSRPSWWCRRRSGRDPKEKSAVLEEAEPWSLTTLREKLVTIAYLTNAKFDGRRSHCNWITSSRLYCMSNGENQFTPHNPIT